MSVLLPGDPCTEHTRGSMGWLRFNLGSFSSLASYKDLVAINPDFEAVSDGHLVH